MNQARSINQKPLPDALPDFRNLGVTLRILLVCNGIALSSGILLAEDWRDVVPRTAQVFALLAPVLLAALLLLWVIKPWLARQPWRQGYAMVVALVVALTHAIYLLGGELYHATEGSNVSFDLMRLTLASGVTATLLLAYFRLRSRVLSRALHDARLQALRARIRPHFLFNTLNAVLGIMRSQPKRAETALEDLSDLFRMAMSESSDLVPLRHEIELCKQYLALEKIRLGDRLLTEWRVSAPEGARIPPLLLQPLLENAVYHGIEPLPQGGNIRITVDHRDDELRIIMENPSPERGKEARPGSHIALENIRERLDLLFDVEARYEVEHGGDFYRVEIVLPCKKGETHE